MTKRRQQADVRVRACVSEGMCVCACVCMCVCVWCFLCQCARVTVTMTKLRQRADVRVRAWMDVCLRVTGDDGDIDYVYVNAQG